MTFFKRSSLIFCAILLVFGTFLLHKESGESRSLLRESIQLDAVGVKNHHNFIIEGRVGYNAKTTLLVQLDGTARLKVGQSIFFLTPDYDGADYEVDLSGQQPRYKIPFYSMSEDRLESQILNVSDSVLTVYDIQIKPLKLTHRTTLDKHSLKLLLALCVGLMFILPFLSRQKAVSQWLIVCGTVIFILYNHFLFGSLFFVLLGVFYKSRYLMQNKAGSSPYKIYLIITFLIAFLILFKYKQDVLFFAAPGHLSLLMPIGISYFLIRLIDTALRWYRGESQAVTFREFLLFIIFPGTLLAGPIESVDSFFKRQLEKITLDDFRVAIPRLVLGLFKKFVIADFVIHTLLHGQFTGRFLGLSGDIYSQVTLAPTTVPHIAILAYTFCFFLFVYMDFSAYSDIAISVSRMMGYRISENFNFPIIAHNISEYWKRWHMTLSGWCMRNIFFPLMLKLKSNTLPLYVTMLVVGMWHTPNASWFFWAIHHGSGLAIYSKFQGKLKSVSFLNYPWMHPLKIMVTIGFVMAGFCFASISDFDVAITLYKRFWLGFIGL